MPSEDKPLNKLIHYWIAIECEYRACQLPLREIARIYQVSVTSITQRAKRLHCQKDFSEAVRKRTRQKMIEAGYNVAPGYAATDAEIVEAASGRALQVLQSHQEDLGKLGGQSPGQRIHHCAQFDYDNLPHRR